MTSHRMPITLSLAVLALGGAWAFVPALAQTPATPKSGLTGIPCRVSWTEETSGGDTFSTHGEITLARFVPQGNGSFVAFGSGTGEVTYHSADRCRIGSGSPWTANYMVTIDSRDGKTATVDISSMDDEHTIVTFCPGAPGTGQFNADYNPPEPPSATVPLRDGVATPFSVQHGSGRLAAGSSGTVTLHYCTPPGQ